MQYPTSISVLLFFFATHAWSQLYKDPAASVEDRIEDLMPRMTAEEKARLLHPNYFSTKEIPRLGIPNLKFINGSYGLRYGGATSFCTAVNLAATWNPELVNRVGVAMAEEVKTTGRNMILGPVILMHRIPQAGRNAESYSEDPYLAGTIATSVIKGLQSRKVPATADFLGAKTTEYHSHYYDVRVSERALNEIYLPAFRMAVWEGKVWGIMTPYNRLNGVRAANSHYLLWQKLKGEWGHKGLVMTDWAGVQNFQASIYAGLDLDMWGGRTYTMENLTDVYETATKDPRDRYGMKLHASRLDESVRRILRVMFANGMFEEPPVEMGYDTASHRELSLEVAEESITLLRNENGILPFDPGEIRSLAVIGPNADVTRHSIRWASMVLPNNTVTPLEGIEKLAGDRVRIRYSQGCTIDDLGDFLDEDEVVSPGGHPGFRVEFFNNGEFRGKSDSVVLDPCIGYNFIVHPFNRERESREGRGEYSVRATGMWTPKRSGYYRVYVNTGDISVKNEEGREVSEVSTAGKEMKEVNGQRYYYFDRKNTYAIRAEYVHSDWYTFQLRRRYYEPNGLENAVAAAERSDAAVLFLGFSETIERENQDRSPDLPDNQIELVRSVAAANPNLVVVLNTGSGVSVDPWGDDARGIIQACYPGQESGTAIAGILFGKVNPSGKLPFTMMHQWKDSPVYGHYPQGEDGMLHYVEGIYVGYRWFDRPDTPGAAFPFGHGLSYTTFDYSDLAISPERTATGEVHATVRVTNTGERAGTEVVQLYIGDTHASVDRPVKELKGYQKVFLEPGDSEKVSFTIEPDDLRFYDMLTRGWKSEPGEFTVFIGSSSKDIREMGKFSLAE